MIAGLESTNLLWLLLAVPAAGALLIWLTGRSPNLREGATLLTAVALCVLVGVLAERVLGGARPDLTLVETFPLAPVRLTVEPLGMMFALIASFLWIVNSVYSIGYMRGNEEKHQTRFYICFAIAISSTMGIAMAGNLFTLFLFYEVLTLSTYPLVTHKGNDEAQRAGWVYLGILLGTSICLFLSAILITYLQAGTLDFTAGGILKDKVAPWLGALLLLLYMYGIGKAALMPIHPWLPAAMVAPTPVSALLHAVAVVKAGVFCVVKIVVYVFGIDYLASLPWTEWLAWVAGGTVLIASFVALTADNLKRRLAYSTVSQLSYVVMAAALFTPIAILGAALHIAAHAFGKITLFFAAGSIYTAAHKTEVSQLDGIGRRMPWTMGAFAIGAISMIGLPPTAGFVSKWYILLGAMEAEHIFVIVVLILSTVLNAGYFLPVVWRAFFRAPPDDHDHGEAPLPIVLALSVTALGTLVLFFYPDLPMALARAMVGG